MNDVISVVVRYIVDVSYFVIMYINLFFNLYSHRVSAFPPSPSPYTHTHTQKYSIFLQPRKRAKDLMIHSVWIRQNEHCTTQHTLASQAIAKYFLCV